MYRHGFLFLSQNLFGYGRPAPFFIILYSRGDTEKSPSVYAAHYSIGSKSLQLIFGCSNTHVFTQEGTVLKMEFQKMLKIGRAWVPARTAATSCRKAPEDGKNPQECVFLTAHGRFSILTRFFRRVPGGLEGEICFDEEDMDEIEVPVLLAKCGL